MHRLRGRFVPGRSGIFELHDLPHWKHVLLLCNVRRYSTMPKWELLIERSVQLLKLQNWYFPKFGR